MPLINVIPGDKIPVAPMNLRLPAWRIPGWLLVFWWLLRGLVRVAVLAVRYWWLTVPTGLALWLRLEYGGLVLASVALAVVAVCMAWWRWHPVSWLRFGWYPMSPGCGRWWSTGSGGRR
ncbi:hypothetical protein ACQSSU_23610 [Micromonospora echinospora]